MNNTITPTDIADLDRLETIIENGRQTFVEVGTALTEIRDRKLYRRDYNTFEAYCQEKWGWKKSHAYRMIDAVELTSSLPPAVAQHVTTEATARELSNVPPADRVQTIQKIIASGAPVTAVSIKATPPTPRAENTAGMGQTVSPIGDKNIQATSVPKQESDSIGFPIPDEILPIWRRAQEVQDVVSSLAKVKGMLERAQASDDPLWREINYSSAIADLNAAKTTIGTAKPYAVCPTCQGQGMKPRCGLCKGRGFISKFRWDTAIPEEMKELRRKVCER